MHTEERRDRQMIRRYELIYIAKPDLDAAKVTALIERVNGLIAADGGTVVKTTQWGLRHLSYPIRKFRDGHYVFSVVEMESPTLARIEQRLRLLEDILRYLLVRADEAESDGQTSTDASDAGEMDVMGGVELNGAETATENVEAVATPAAPIESPAESALEEATSPAAA